MKNSTRKVVILENITSPYIQQAIIVLNEYAAVKESKVIYDAERIVDEYLRKNGYQGQLTARELKKKNPKKNRFWGIVSTVLIFFSIAVYFMINK